MADQLYDEPEYKDLRDAVESLVSADFNGLDPALASLANSDWVARQVFNDVLYWVDWYYDDENQPQVLEGKDEIYALPQYQNLYAAIRSLLDSDPPQGEDLGELTKFLFEHTLFWGDWYWEDAVADEEEGQDELAQGFRNAYEDIDNEDRDAGPNPYEGPSEWDDVDLDAVRQDYSDLKFSG